MIKSLSIQNYALIRELEMLPAAGLNIITGETGAGKSIMLGALGLLLGNRADTKALWDDSKKCNVEGIFELSNYNLKSLFDVFELDYEEECIIRREISPSGKSRAFVNDTPVTLDVLKRLGERLMDIHSQHQSLQLGSNIYQQYLLDTFARNGDLLDKYSQAFAEFKEKQKELARLQDKAENAAKELDYQQFLVKELREADLDHLEQEVVEEELAELENAEEIKSGLSRVEQILDHEDMGALTNLKDIQSTLRSLSQISGTYQQLFERIDSVSIELADVLLEINNLNEKTLLDPERQETVKSKLDLLYRLQQKHQMDSVQDLVKLRDELENEIQEVENLDESIKNAESSLKESESILRKYGELLSESRRSSALILSSEVEKLIQQLGIENGKVLVEVNQIDIPKSNGLDEIAILFSANKGVQPREIKEVASGGEFSRLIFALKFLLADKTALPTIIFDEIDTGVSGEIALKMISMMKRMAKTHQIISISHLPQFAAGGDFHYFVYKDHTTDKSETRIQLLDSDQRVEAIARMIGGNNPSEKAFESARELMQHPAL